MTLASLWLPILVSAIVVWLASSVAHMVLKHHKADYRKLPDENGVAAALRKPALEPALYVLPYCSDMSQMKDEAMLARYKQGPIALITVLRTGLPNMGKSLGQYFGWCLLVALFVGYVARLALPPGAEGMMVFRLTAATAIGMFMLGRIPESIWLGAPWSNTLRMIADGVVYGLLTGATFMLLWPS